MGSFITETASSAISTSLPTMEIAEEQHAKIVKVDNSGTELATTTTADAHLDFKMKRKTIRTLVARHRRVQGVVFPVGARGKSNGARLDVWKLYQRLIAGREQELCSEVRMAAKEDTAMASAWMNSTLKFLTRVETAIEQSGLNVQVQEGDASVGQAGKESEKKFDPPSEGKDVPEDPTWKQNFTIRFLMPVENEMEKGGMKVGSVDTPVGEAVELDHEAEISVQGTKSTEDLARQQRKRLAFSRWRQQVEKASASVGRVEKESGEIVNPSSEARAIEKQLARKERKRLAFFRWRKKQRMRRQAQRFFPSHGSNISSLVRKYDVRSKAKLAAAAEAAPPRPAAFRSTLFGRRLKALLPPDAERTPGVISTLHNVDMRSRRRRRHAVRRAMRSRVPSSGGQRKLFRYQTRYAEVQMVIPPSGGRRRLVRRVHRPEPLPIKSVSWDNKSGRHAWKSGKAAWEALVGGEGLEAADVGGEDQEWEDEIRRQSKEELLRGVRGIVGVDERDGKKKEKRYDAFGEIP